MKIIIKKCNNTRYWYYYQIGRIVEVKSEGANLYHIFSDNKSEQTVLKEDAEMVEDVKSCETCSSNECNLCGVDHIKWQPIETMRKTAEENAIEWSKNNPVSNKYKLCTNCLYGVDKPKDKCNICHPVNKTNWHEQDEIVTNDSGRQSKNEWIKQGDGTTNDAKHYMTGKQQPIEIMQEKMTQEQFVGFLLGNVIKYSLRINHKDNDREDAGKCSQYAKWLVQAMDGDTIIPGGK